MIDRRQTLMRPARPFRAEAMAEIAFFCISVKEGAKNSAVPLLRKNTGSCQSVLDFKYAFLLRGPRRVDENWGPSYHK